jgi:hypothetical protein
MEGTMNNKKICPRCDGAKTYEGWTCQLCNGAGEIDDAMWEEWTSVEEEIRHETEKA